MFTGSSSALVSPVPIVSCGRDLDVHLAYHIECRLLHHRCSCSPPIWKCAAIAVRNSDALWISRQWCCLPHLLLLLLLLLLLAVDVAAAIATPICCCCCCCWLLMLLLAAAAINVDPAFCLVGRCCCCCRRCFSVAFTRSPPICRPLLLPWS